MKTRHHQYRLWLLVTLAVAACGCEGNYYRIELTPSGDSLQRQLTCYRAQSPQQERAQVVAFPEDELRRIAEAYGAAVPADKAAKHRFAAEFAARMPDDVGGSGSFTHWTTPLGSVSAYVERFRGNDDLVAEVEKRQQAADRIADLLVGWLASELEDQAGFAELHKFLDGGLRRDLKNLSLYGWAYDVASQYDEEAQQECVMRVGQYLAERGYFTPDQLPAVTRALRQVEQDGPLRLLALVQRFVATKMGVAGDQPIPASLRFLSDLSLIETSVNNYLRGTEDFHRLMTKWEAENADNPEAEKPRPHVVFDELVGVAFLSNIQLFGGGADRLDVKLASQTEPFLTNGEWDQQNKQVSWSHEIAANRADDSQFPTLLYAYWSKPDEAAQRARFGTVVLEGGNLGFYCLWQRGLTADEAKEWNEFVASLQPDPNLVRRIDDFRFSRDAARPAEERDQAADDYSSTARELILSALRG